MLAAPATACLLPAIDARTSGVSEQSGDVVGAETRQGERLAAGAGLRQQVPQRVVGSDIGVAIAADDEYWGGADLLDHEGQEADRGGVGPLEVVDHQHQRPGAAAILSAEATRSKSTNRCSPGVPCSCPRSSSAAADVSA